MTRLLLADNQDLLPSSLDAVLLEGDYQLTRVTGSGEALAHLERGEIDLLLVHVEMLTGSDDALLAYLDDCQPVRCPGVLIIAAEPNAALYRYLTTHAHDYLLPPFDPALVNARIQAALERRYLHARQQDLAKNEELLKLERDVQIGRNIQLGFLPQTLPQPEGWEITACFHPAREVAGDFYDAFYLINKRRVGFVIADVCDKGVGAALFMALFRTLIRSNAQHNTSLNWMDPYSASVTENKDWLKGDPSQRRQSLPTIGTGALMNAIAGTNDYITENHLDQGYFATMFFGLFDPTNGSLLYINGGHNPPVIVRADGTTVFLKPTGPAVGMLPGVTYKIGQTRLGPGDLLYAYTDGVTDARSPDGKFFSEARLFSLVAEGALNAKELIANIEGQLKEHIGGAAQFDDITMIALRREADNNEHA